MIPVSLSLLLPWAGFAANTAPTLGTEPMKPGTVVLTDTKTPADKGVQPNFRSWLFPSDRTVIGEGEQLVAVMLVEAGKLLPVTPQTMTCPTMGAAQ